MDETWFTPKRILHWCGGGLAAFSFLAIAFGAGSIQRDAERRANEILLLGGFDWARAEASGRGVAVLGIAPSEVAGAAAVEAVERDWAVRAAWPAFTVSAPAPTVGGVDAGRATVRMVKLGDAV